jgi:excisionase family DNA binding protein
MHLRSGSASSANTRSTRRAPPAPITKTIADTCHITDLGRTKIYDLIAKGKLKSTTVGRRRLVFYASIEALLRGDDS